VGGLALLGAAVIGLGAGVTLLAPERLDLRAWVEPFLIAGAGYALYLGLRLRRPALPRFTLDRAMVSLLGAAIVLAGAISFALWRWR